MSFRKQKPAVLLSIYLIISLVILRFNLPAQIESATNFLRYSVVSLCTNMEKLAFSVENLGNTLKELMQVRDELWIAKQQNKILSYELAKLKALRAENDNLRRHLDLKKQIPRKTTIASVMVRPAPQYHKSFFINKGSEHGMIPGKAVYGFYGGRLGVVGSLSDVGSKAATVLTITNRLSKIPARVTSAGVDGLLTGQAKKELELLWIPADADIRIGDEVVTSPVSDIFPPGIPIGLIISVNEAQYLPFKSAKVKPMIPSPVLSEVFVEW